MKNILRINIISLIFIIIFTVSYGEDFRLSNLANASEKFITIGTGNITGIYYPAGGAICRLVNRFRKDYGVRCSVESTSGSLYNIKSLNSNELDLAIIQSDLQYEAYNGIGTFIEKGTNKSLRSIFSLHEDAFTVIARADSGIRNFEDIRGKRINLGSLGSGSRTMIERLMEIYGWDKEDFPDISELKASEQPEALCTSKIDVMIYSVGHPNGAVREAATSCETIIIPVTGKKIEEFIRHHPYYVETVIPGGMYAGNPNDIRTFGVKATIVALDSLNENTVYNITKTIFENLDYFKGLHPVLSNLNKGKMILEGNTIPLHKGAERYFRENGLL